MKYRDVLEYDVALLAMDRPMSVDEFHRKPKKINAWKAVIPNGLTQGLEEILVVIVC